MVKWSDASPQAKLFVITHVIVMLTELVGEISLFTLIPNENKAMRTRFWAQYVLGAACAAVMGSIGYLATDCLSKSGWTKTAWASSLLPTLTLGSGGFLLHGVDSILGASSGTGSVALIRAAYVAKKKKSITKQ